jgi:hypothetical protein
MGEPIRGGGGRWVPVVRSARPQSGGDKNGDGKLKAFTIAAVQAGARPFG